MTSDNFKKARRVYNIGTALALNSKNRTLTKGELHLSYSEFSDRLSIFWKDKHVFEFSAEDGLENFVENPEFIEFLEKSYNASISKRT